MSEQTNALLLHHFFVFYFACSSNTYRAHPGLGEAEQTLNNVSLLEQLGVKTQCEISETKHVGALLILLPVSLTCRQMNKKTAYYPPPPPPRRHPQLHPFPHHSPSRL